MESVERAGMRLKGAHNAHTQINRSARILRAGGRRLAVRACAGALCAPLRRIPALSTDSNPPSLGPGLRRELQRCGHARGLVPHHTPYLQPCLLPLPLPLPLPIPLPFALILTLTFALTFDPCPYPYPYPDPHPYLLPSLLPLPLPLPLPTPSTPKPCTLHPRPSTLNPAP